MNKQKVFLAIFIFCNLLNLCYGQLNDKEGSSIRLVNSEFFFSIYDDLDIVINKIGEPKSYYNEDSKVYTLTWENGLVIQAINKHYICFIKINSSNFQTEKGVCVGDSFSKVYKIYGNPQFKYDTILTYNMNIDKGTIIVFMFENNKVKEIIIGYGS